MPGHRAEYPHHFPGFLRRFFAVSDRPATAPRPDIARHLRASGCTPAEVRDALHDALAEQPPAVMEGRPAND